MCNNQLVFLNNHGFVTAGCTFCAFECESKDLPRITAAMDAQRELTELQEAVTPSAATKAAYMGEFSFFETYIDEDGEEKSQEFIVPWITIKDIMKAIRARAAVDALVAGV